MTTLKIDRLDDGRVLIQTFDFRSEFAFQDFCDWVSQELGVTLNPAVSHDELEPRVFSFEGETLRLAWQDEYGCYVEGDSGQVETIERVKKRLAEG